MQDRDSDRFFDELLAQQKKIVALLENQEQGSPKETQRKDFWDKFGTLSTFLSSVLIASIGLIFTSVYNERQNQRNEDLKKQEIHLSEIQTLEKFMPHLTGDEKSKEIAILAMSSLGNTELAARLATLYPTKGTVLALTAIAQSGNEANRKIADSAITEIFSKNRPAAVDVEIQSSLGPVKFPGILLTSDGYVASASLIFKDPKGDPGFSPAFDKPAIITSQDGKKYTAKCVLKPTDGEANPGVIIYKIDGSGYAASRLAESPPLLGDPVLLIDTQLSDFALPAQAVPLVGQVEKIEAQYLTVATPVQHLSKDMRSLGGAVLNMQGQVIGIIFGSSSLDSSTTHDIFVRSDAILALLKERGVRP